MRYILTVLALAVLAGPAAASSSYIPALADPGFEANAKGWGWHIFGPFQVSYTLSSTNPHSGKTCLEFTCSTPLTPNWFGRFESYANVLPSTRYELSCWVRGEEVSGEGGSSHFTDWGGYTLNLPTGTFGWKRVSVEFNTNPGQTTVALGLNIVNKCKTLALDDIELRPVGGRLEGKGISGIILCKPKVIGHNTPVATRLFVDCSATDAAVVESTVTTAGFTQVDYRRWFAKPGSNKFEWEWNTGMLPFGRYNCTVRVLDEHNQALATGAMDVQVVDSPIMGDIDKVEVRKKEFDSLYRQCQAKGIRLDYPTVAKTMLEQFIPLSRDDVRAGLDWRAKFAITDFNRTLDNGIKEMKAYLADPTLAPVAKRYQTSETTVDGLSFVGDRVDSLGHKDRGPVFFCGFGHFPQARKDMPRWPGYGVNIIQSAEFGPAQVFPAEDKVDLQLVNEILKAFDDAAKHNVRVDLLLSPHYFPAWAMQKYPQLAKGGGGFLGYCVDDPAAKQIVEKFLRLIVPMSKDKPALNSFCLSNEPMFNNTANCDNTRDMWNAYLTRLYGSIDALNKNYGSSYKSFNDVPAGGWNDPQFYDYCMFNNERFVAWHKWMGDICHEIAPNVPVHAKVMSTALNRDFVTAGDDHELFGRQLDLNGNDCYMFPTHNQDWPIDPWLQNSTYDMQRSFARKPIFNSENHIAPDGSTFYMSPSHYRVALWQGAIHGQGATTIWVWEREFINRNGFVGNVMDRPGCAQAVGVTCLDLNRFADEVTALENAEAPVAVVYSMSSMIRHGPEHAGALMKAYVALNFCGIKIDFISERQLAEGKGKQYKVIVVPEVETITDAAFDAIRALPTSTRLLFLGTCFARDPYGHERDEQQIKDVIAGGTVLTNGDQRKDLWPQLRKELESAGALPEWSVVDAKTGEPVWGLEWLPASVGGRTIINMLNYTHRVEVKVLRSGKEVPAKDLLSLGGREPVSLVKALTPVLAEVSE